MQTAVSTTTQKREVVCHGSQMGKVLDAKRLQYDTTYLGVRAKHRKDLNLEQSALHFHSVDIIHLRPSIRATTSLNKMDEMAPAGCLQLDRFHALNAARY